MDGKHLPDVFSESVKTPFLNFAGGRSCVFVFERENQKNYGHSILQRLKPPNKLMTIHHINTDILIYQRLGYTCGVYEKSTSKTNTYPSY